jgi:hypothetical protein
MDPILALAEHHGLAVVEDACQAQGRSTSPPARERGGARGRWDRPRRSASTRQESRRLRRGGAPVTTNVPGGGRARGACCATTGQSRKYVHDLVGYNGRLDAIQAGFLLVKLPHLTGWNEGATRGGARVRRPARGCARRHGPARPGLVPSPFTTCTWSRSTTASECSASSRPRESGPECTTRSRSISPRHRAGSATARRFPRRGARGDTGAVAPMFPRPLARAATAGRERAAPVDHATSRGRRRGTDRRWTRRSPCPRRTRRCGRHDGRETGSAMKVVLFCGGMGCDCASTRMSSQAHDRHRVSPAHTGT